MCCIDTYICTYQLLQSDLLITQMEVTYINPWKGHNQKHPKRSRREEAGIIYEITYIYIYKPGTPLWGAKGINRCVRAALFFPPVARLAASRLPFCFWPLRPDWQDFVVSTGRKQHEVEQHLKHNKNTVVCFQNKGIYIYRSEIPIISSGFMMLECESNPDFVRLFDPPKGMWLDPWRHQPKRKPLSSSSPWTKHSR